ncbi:hypothetical protein ACFQHX_05465, partial [Streptococcus loxodontisalivarius]
MMLKQSTGLFEVGNRESGAFILSTQQWFIGAKPPNELCRGLSKLAKPVRKAPNTCVLYIRLQKHTKISSEEISDRREYSLLFLCV